MIKKNEAQKINDTNQQRLKELLEYFTSWVRASETIVITALHVARMTLQ